METEGIIRPRVTPGPGTFERAILDVENEKLSATIDALGKTVSELSTKLAKI